MGDLADYFAMRADENNRKAESCEGEIHALYAGIAIGRRRSERELRDEIDGQFDDQ